MSEFNLQVFLLIAFFLINLIAFVYFSKVLYKNFKLRRQQINRLKKLEENKCKGPHSWISMEVDGSQTHVCRDCYFSPKHDMFVKEYFVKEAVYSEQFDLDYKKYFDEKVQEIAQAYGISGDKIIEINDKVTHIKQEFSLQYLKKMLQEVSQDLEKK